MNKSVLSVFLLLVIIAGSGCNNRGTVSESAHKSESAHQQVHTPLFTKLYPEFDFGSFRNQLKHQVANDSITQLLYGKYEYKPVWVTDTINTTGLNELITILQQVEVNHGLSQQMFPLETIVSLSDSIGLGIYSGNMDLLYKKMSDLEMLSTEATMHYIEGMTYGFTNPKLLFLKNYAIETLTADSVFLEQMYSDIYNDPITAIKQSEPSDEVYLKMQDEYKKLESKKEIEAKKVENKGINFAYKLGDKNKNITAIAERLTLTGDYYMDSLGNDSLVMLPHPS